MQITYRNHILITGILAFMVGCQSGPRWAWWKSQSASPDDTSLVARSADTSTTTANTLPSKQATPQTIAAINDPSGGKGTSLASSSLASSTTKPANVTVPAESSTTVAAAPSAKYPDSGVTAPSVAASGLPYDPKQYAPAASKLASSATTDSDQPADRYNSAATDRYAALPSRYTAAPSTPSTPDVSGTPAESSTAAADLPSTASAAGVSAAATGAADRYAKTNNRYSTTEPSTPTSPTSAAIGGSADENAAPPAMKDRYGLLGSLPNVASNVNAAAGAATQAATEAANSATTQPTNSQYPQVASVGTDASAAVIDASTAATSIPRPPAGDVSTPIDAAQSAAASGLATAAQSASTANPLRGAADPLGSLSAATEQATQNASRYVDPTSATVSSATVSSANPTASDRFAQPQPQGSLMAAAPLSTVKLAAPAGEYRPAGTSTYVDGTSQSSLDVATRPEQPRLTMPPASLQR